MTMIAPDAECPDESVISTDTMKAPALGGGRTSTGEITPGMATLSMDPLANPSMNQ